MTYPGAGFLKVQAGKRSSGQIEVQRQHLVFSNTHGQQLMIPLEDLQISRGGAKQRLIFFKHPHFPEESLYSTDPQILEDPNLLANLKLKEQCQQLHADNQKAKWWGIGSVAAVLLLVFAFIGFRDPLAGFLAKGIPKSWEVQLGQKIMSLQKLNSRFVEDPKVIEELELLSADLINSLPDFGYPFQLYIVEDSQLNAYALPGGHIALHSGLLLKAQSIEEVLGVLAHEIAHVAKRHGLRQVIGTAGLAIIAQALIGDFTGLLALIADSGTFLLTQGYSRAHERQADELGWLYLVHARVSPEGLIEFMKRVKQEHEKLALSEVSGKLDFLSTHPATDKRIARLEKKWQDFSVAQYFPRKDPLPFENFQAMLESVLFKNSLDTSQKGDEHEREHGGETRIQPSEDLA